MEDNADGNFKILGLKNLFDVDDGTASMEMELHYSVSMQGHEGPAATVDEAVNLTTVNNDLQEPTEMEREYFTMGWRGRLFKRKTTDYRWIWVLYYKERVSDGITISDYIVETECLVSLNKLKGWLETTAKCMTVGSSC